MEQIPLELHLPTAYNIRGMDVYLFGLSSSLHQGELVIIRTSSQWLSPSILLHYQLEDQQFQTIP